MVRWFLFGTLALLLVGNAGAQTKPRKFAGQVEADEFIGIISDTTIRDASGYADDETEWIFADIAARLEYLTATPAIPSITITIKPQGQGIYSFKEKLAIASDKWYMPFPENKHVDPDGLFTCTINGWEFAPLARIITGEGGRQLGLQFVLLDGSQWPAGTEGIGSIQLIDFIPWAIPDYETDQVRTVKTVISEGLVRNLVNF